MSEPPLPIISTGEVRNFDLLIPGGTEFGGSGSPGAQPDPSGAAGIAACQVEIEALVTAVNTDPTPAAIAALFNFLEGSTGQSMEELVGASWAQLVEDGETITTTIDLPACNAIVELTLGGELVLVDSCTFLPPIPPITFDKNDFDMSEVITDTYVRIFTPGGTTLSETYESHNDIFVHLEEPEPVYLETRFYGGGANQTLVNRLARIGQIVTSNQASVAANPIGFGTSPSDPYLGGSPAYYPYYRMKGYWTCKIEEVSVGIHDADPLIPDRAEFYYSTAFPLMGFKNLLAQETAIDQLPDYPGVQGYYGRLLTDPLETGYNEWGNAFEAGIDYTAEDSELPTGSAFAGRMSFTQGGTFGRSFWLPHIAIGDPTFHSASELGAPVGSPGIYDWADNSSSKALSFLGFSRSVIGETKADAWEMFVEEVAEYQAFAGEYDPVVELDEENMEIRVTFDTNLNACYLPQFNCNDNVYLDFSGAFLTIRPLYTNPIYQAWTMSWGGYWHDLGWGQQSTQPRPAAYKEPVGGIVSFPTIDGPEIDHEDFYSYPFDRWLDTSATRANTNFPEDNFGYTMSRFVQIPLPRIAGEFNPIIEAGEVAYPTEDGSPSPTEPNPPITPVGGGCRSYLDGPSSCNWNVPVPAAPQPEVPEPFEPDFPEPPSPGNPKTPTPDFPHIPRTPNFPMPRDRFPGPPSPESPAPPALPEAPVITTDLPNIPRLPCIVPDFGNIDPCGGGNGNGAGRHPGAPGSGGAGAGPGTMGPLPGGRDFMGNRGSAGTIASVKTGGQTYDARTYLFTETTCPGQVTPGIGCMAVIVQLLMDAGIAPVDIIFQVGPESDKPFPVDKCFVKGSRIFDAAMWTARFLMLTIVDEGTPTNDVYIGPPWHRPLQTVWTFDEHYDLFNLSRAMSSEEAYGWVEVYGPNVTSPIIVRIEDPFSTDDSPTLRVEVGANFTQEDAEGLGAYKASIMMRQTVSVQATVPYSSDYFLRDLMLIQAPDRGFQETYVITGKESDMSAAGRFHILTGMLPATLAELDSFPTVTDEYDAVEGGFA